MTNDELPDWWQAPHRPPFNKGDKVRVRRVPVDGYIDHSNREGVVSNPFATYNMIKVNFDDSGSDLYDEFGLFYYGELEAVQ